MNFRGAENLKFIIFCIISLAMRGACANSQRNKRPRLSQTASFMFRSLRTNWPRPIISQNSSCYPCLSFWSPPLVASSREVDFKAPSAPLRHVWGAFGASPSTPPPPTNFAINGKKNPKKLQNLQNFVWFKNCKILQKMQKSKGMNGAASAAWKQWCPHTTNP